MSRPRLSDATLRSAIRSTAEPLGKDELTAIGDLLYGKRGALARVSNGDIARRLHIEAEMLNVELADMTMELLVANRMVVSEQRVSDYLLEKTGLSRQEVERATGWVSLEELVRELGLKSPASEGRGKESGEADPSAGGPSEEERD